MEETIIISYLNDFIYCPASIYFHKLYGKIDGMIYQGVKQIEGKEAHRTIDKKIYSSRKDVFQGIEVYSSKYNIIGKIDMYDAKKKILIERKNKVNEIYDGYIYQVYAEYFCLVEQGYEVNKIVIHSLKDNKNYNIKLPVKDKTGLEKFEAVIKNMRNFNLDTFKQKNKKKCENCIYEPLCDRSLLC